MFRNLKALGLLVSAALAIGATFAAGAQGQTPGTFTAGTTDESTTSYKHEAVDIHGEQYGSAGENYLKAFGTEITCENEGITYVGATAGTATELALAPTYNDCALGSLPATVHTNGCRYLLKTPQTVGEAEYTGGVALSCPVGQSIDIEVFGSGGVTSHEGGVLCTVQLFATGAPTEEEGKEHTVQELGGHVLYSNGVREADGRHDVTASMAIEGISMTRKGTCTFGVDQTSESGVLHGKITLTASREAGCNPPEPRDIWISEVEEK